MQKTMLSGIRSRFRRSRGVPNRLPIASHALPQRSRQPEISLHHIRCIARSPEKLCENPTQIRTAPNSTYRHRTLCCRIYLFCSLSFALCCCPAYADRRTQITDDDGCGASDQRMPGKIDARCRQNNNHGNNSGNKAGVGVELVRLFK